MANTKEIKSYRGLFSVKQVDKLLHELKDILQDKDIGLIIRKRLYNLAVECLDNIFRHSDYGDSAKSIQQLNPSQFQLLEDANNFYVITGNLVLNENIPTIIKKITKLNELKSEEINKLYKEALSKAEISEKGGAGLGLIVMAKITGNKIAYHFDEINDKFSYFSMQLRLKKYQ